MTIDWQTFLAILAGLAGLYTAFSTRRKSEGDVASLAVESAGKSLQMREKDIQLLERKIEQLFDYTHYLNDWIKENVRPSKRGPLTFEQFIHDDS